MLKEPIAETLKYLLVSCIKKTQKKQVNLKELLPQSNTQQSSSRLAPSFPPKLPA